MNSTDVSICVKLLDVGARNHRRLCAVYYSKTPGFEVSVVCDEYLVYPLIDSKSLY